MTAAISTEGLSRCFGGIRAVDGLTFRVDTGQLFGIVGPDGAGKSTLVRLLAGILSVTGGDAWVAGRSLRDDDEALRGSTGYMAQRFALYPDLTVAENIDFYAAVYGISAKNRATRTTELLALTGLDPFRRRLAGNLSGGMRQKLSLCCALVHAPKVLLLDEPTSGVDPLSRRDFWRILSHVRRDGVTVLLSTSYVDEAERCGRVGFLHQGRLIATGTPTELKRLMRSDILEIEVSDCRRGVTLLRQHPEVRFADRFGDRLHAVTLGSASTAVLEAALTGNGIVVHGIRPIQPTLEDVFVSLIREQDENPTA